MYQIVHYGPLPPQRVRFARMIHLLSLYLTKPLTSNFLTSSHRDRNMFKQLMSGYCIVISLSSNVHQVVRQPYTSLVVVDWSVVCLVCGNVSHRKLVDRCQKRTHRKTGHRSLSFSFWPVLLRCFANSRDNWSHRCGSGMCSAAHCRLKCPLTQSRPCRLHLSVLPLTLR